MPTSVETGDVTGVDVIEEMGVSRTVADFGVLDISGTSGCLVGLTKGEIFGGIEPDVLSF